MKTLRMTALLTLFCLTAFILGCGQAPQQAESTPATTAQTEPATQTSQLETILKRGTIKVGFDTFKPWAMKDKNGEFIGFEIDVAKKLAAD
ncbi:transporter substrate-binding domain-containing protein, partial [Pseudodesulfovibrio sp.]|nr:transporter substrate-binding domain-containing protein [Pseudodesulfovibrio sp.]